MTTNLPTFQLNPPTLTTLETASASLKHIAVAEAGERHWARAKDAKQLFEAIKSKLENQASYAVWRQDVVVPSQQEGGTGSNQHRRVARISAQKSELPDADPGAVQVFRWRERLCEKDGKRWVVAKVKLQDTLQDAHHRCVRICEQENANTIRGTEGTGEFERYTPAEYVEAVREVLGTIDLDPASSALAQQTVAATTYFDERANGLEQDWNGRVFLNPPYHRELAPQFIDKLIVELDAGRTTAAILLTNNSTDTQWFRIAAQLCQCICFTTGRIQFTKPNASPVLPTQGQAFFYFGDQTTRFTSMFSEIKEIGFCVRPVHGP